MKSIVSSILSTWLISLAFTVWAADTGTPQANTPLPRVQEYSWMSVAQWYQQHQEDVALAQRGDANLVFLGDSITAGWPHNIWETNFKQFKPVNFGIGGDQTQNVLWRLQNGGIGQLQPKIIVLLIGVNNFGHSHHTPPQVYQGIKTITEYLHQSTPKTTIVLLGILPYGEQPNTGSRRNVTKANRLIQSLDSLPYISYYDFGADFLEPDGTIAKAIMADFLHPTEAGYQILAAKLTPILTHLNGIGKLNETNK